MLDILHEPPPDARYIDRPQDLPEVQGGWKLYCCPGGRTIDFRVGGTTARVAYALTQGPLLCGSRLPLGGYIHALRGWGLPITTVYARDNGRTCGVYVLPPGAMHDCPVWYNNPAYCERMRGPLGGPYWFDNLVPYYPDQGV